MLLTNDAKVIQKEVQMTTLNDIPRITSGLGFDSRNFHNFKCGLCLERSKPSVVRTIGWLLDRKLPDQIKQVDIIILDGV